MKDLKEKINKVLHEIKPEFPILENIKIYLNKEYEVAQTEQINNVVDNNEKIQVYAYSSELTPKDR